MSLDDIWDAPLASPPRPVPADGDSTPLKRPRQSLFLADSDSDNERPTKRATPAPPVARPDIDALFEDLDKDKDAEDDLSYKPLAPSLDLAKLAKEADARYARKGQTGSSQVTGGRTEATSGTGKDESGKDETKGKDPDGDKKSGRKVLPKMDEERLVGPEGFPSLIEDIKGFQPRGKGNEHADLNRLVQIYQFWTHRMYPKTSFKDTIDRVEKLCHSRRMQVRLSVWRDEFRGVNKVPDDSDVIDLTEPTLVGTGGDGDDEEIPPPKNDEASSRAPSLPPASSDADDDFDIDAVVNAEEERLAALRATNTDSDPIHTPNSPTLVGKASSGGDSAMDVDEAGLWDALDDPQALWDPPQSASSASAPAVDEDMWDILDEVEREVQQKSVEAQGAVIQSTPTLESDNEATLRPTNADGLEDLYL